MPDKKSQRAPNPSKFAPTRTRRPKKTKTNMYKFAPPRPRLWAPNRNKPTTNSHPLMEDTPAEDLLAAGGVNSGRFGACCKKKSNCFRGSCRKTRQEPLQAILCAQKPGPRPQKKTSEVPAHLKPVILRPVGRMSILREFDLPGVVRGCFLRRPFCASKQS